MNRSEEKELISALTSGKLGSYNGFIFIEDGSFDGAIKPDSIPKWISMKRPWWRRVYLFFRRMF